MKLKWEVQGAVRLGRDHHGWARAILLKDATWIYVAPLGMQNDSVEEVCGYNTITEAKKAAQTLVDRAARASERAA